MTTSLQITLIILTLLLGFDPSLQAYNEANFAKELEYAHAQVGIAITDNQLHRLQGLVEDPKVKGILVFPLSGKPEKTAAKVKSLVLQTESQKGDKSS